MKLAGKLLLVPILVTLAIFSFFCNGFTKLDSASGSRTLDVVWQQMKESDGEESFEMRGFYLTNWHDQVFFTSPSVNACIDWLESIGINFIEFYAVPYERRSLIVPPSLIQYAHEKGMKVHVILFTNWIVIEGGSNPHAGGTYLCPQDEANFIRTVNVNRYYIEQYGDADAFEVFTGDPRGCACGRCNVSTYLRYVKEYHRIIGETGSEAEVYINLWCIAEWSNAKGNRHAPQASATWREFWDYEIVCAEEVIEALPSLPEDVHVILPCHHLYRPFCIQEYEQGKLPNWPNRTVVDRIHAVGRKILGWPHYLYDDNLVEYGLVHSTVGYIKRLLVILKQMRFDGVVGHAFIPNVQQLNTYAFATLAKNTSLTVSEVLKNFSRLIVQEGDAEKLFNVFVLLENHDLWFGLGTMPNYMRIQHPTPTISWEEAASLLEAVEPKSSHLTFLFTPNYFLSKLKETVDKIRPQTSLWGAWWWIPVIGALIIISLTITLENVKKRKYLRFRDHKAQRN